MLFCSQQEENNEVNEIRETLETASQPPAPVVEETYVTIEPTEEKVTLTKDKPDRTTTLEETTQQQQHSQSMYFCIV